MKNCIDVTFEYLDKATLGDSICIKKWALHPPPLLAEAQLSLNIL